MKEVAVYKGDSFICSGTINECAKKMGVLPETIQFYLTPSYQNRIKARKKARNYIEVIKLDNE